MLFMQCYLWSTVQGRVGSWEGRSLLIHTAACSSGWHRARRPSGIESYYLIVVGNCSEILSSRVCRITIALKSTDVFVWLVKYARFI